MKLKRLLHCGLAAVSSLGLSASVFAFEGLVDMQMTSPKQKEPTLMHYQIKGAKTRTDVETPKKDDAKEKGDRTAKRTSHRGKEDAAIAMILDVEAREMITLIDSGDGKQKMFMRSNLDQVAKKAKKSAEQSPPPVKTGRTETIAGYKAEEYTTTAKNGEVTELWLSKELGSFMFAGMGGGNPMAGGRGGPPAPEWEEFVRDGGGFVLRVVSRSKSGTETMRMEATKVEKTKVPDSVFSTEGYQEFQMPNFGDLMSGQTPPESTDQTKPDAKPAKPSVRDAFKGLNPFSR